MAYVANNMHGTVSAVDLTTGTVVADIVMPRRGPRMPFPGLVAATPDGAKVYVANLNGETIGVIDTATNELRKVIPLPQPPRGLAVSADGASLFVTSGGTSLLRIDTGKDEIAGAIPVDAATVGIALSADARRGYVASEKGLLIVDLEAGLVEAVVEGIVTNSAVALNGDGTRAYAIVNVTPRGAVHVIDLAERRVVRRIPLDANPAAAIVSAGGRRLYVVNRGAATVTAIDLAREEVEATIPVAEVPGGIAAAPDGSALYVTGSVGNVLSVVTQSTNEVTRTIALNPPPGARPLGVVAIDVP